jgi:nuclear protein localization protein 4 homolog
MEEQTTDKFLSKLGKLGAPLIADSRIEASFDSRRAREKVAKWLSDWHLLAYWSQVGFLGNADIKELARIATSPNLEEPSLLDGLLEKDGWQTLMTVVADSTRKFLK